MDKIDREAYSAISMLPAKKVLKVFDGYRQLKVQLEERNIFSQELKEKAKDVTGAFVIPANFPKTYKRSSLGLSLGENERFLHRDNNCIFLLRRTIIKT